ncbi:MAG: hypothetical protein ACXU82_12055 [Caulobacteraceae bacterium]
MKPAAIIKANERLERAKKALSQCTASKDFKAFAYYWTDFLTALNQVPSALEKGARDNPQSRQWYGGKKNAGRKDPLLRYLAQARNADEHGIEPVVFDAPDRFRVQAATSAGANIKQIVTDKDGIHITLKPGSGPALVTRKAPGPLLIPVRDDRFNELFMPPSEHLGASIVDDMPAAIGALALAYYEALVDEASRLPQ